MESISSGMNFLKRRFSSQDIADEDKANGVQAQSNPPAPSNLPSLSTFSFAGFANKVSSTIRLVKILSIFDFIKFKLNLKKIYI